MRIRFCLVLGSIAALGACAELDAQFKPTREQPHAARVARTVEDHATRQQDASGRRQYYDQRRQRYYFYDPGRRAYFWEDGSPKS